MPRKIDRAARKQWIDELHTRYGTLHKNSSYLEVARAVSFFTNQIFDPSSKETAAVFLYNSSQGLRGRTMRFVE